MRTLLACLFTLSLTLCLTTSGQAHWKKRGHFSHGYYPATQAQGALLPWLLPQIPPLLNRFVFPYLPTPPGEQPPAEPAPEPITIDPDVIREVDKVYDGVKTAAERFNEAFKDHKKYQITIPENSTGKFPPPKQAPFGR